MERRNIYDESQGGDGGALRDAHGDGSERAGDTWNVRWQVRSLRKESTH